MKSAVVIVPPNAWDFACWERTGWMEARSEGADGRAAVMWVIHNRWQSGRWSHNGRSTLALACLADRQFSAWNADRNDTNREAMAVLDERDDRAFREIRDIMHGILNGSIPDPTAGALHYFARWMIKPEWAVEHRVDIGNHRFYA